MENDRRQMIIIILVTIVLIGVLIFSQKLYDKYFGEATNEKVEEKEDKKEILKPTLEISSSSKKSVTATITDENDEKLSFDGLFTLERKIDNNWELVLDNDDNACGQVSDSNNTYTVGDDNKLEVTYNWNKQCGKLKKGNYRLCIKYGDNDTCDEFTVN